MTLEIEKTFSDALKKNENTNFVTFIFFFTKCSSVNEVSHDDDDGNNVK